MNGKYHLTNLMGHVKMRIASGSRRKPAASADSCFSLKRMGANGILRLVSQEAMTVPFQSMCTGPSRPDETALFNKIDYGGTPLFMYAAFEHYMRLYLE